MARKRHHSDATDENTNDFAFPVRGKWMEDTSLFYCVSSHSDRKLYGWDACTVVSVCQGH